MFDPRHHLAARLRPHLLPFVRRIVEDVLQGVIQRRAMPMRSEFREMQVRAGDQSRAVAELRAELHPNPSRSDGP